MALVQRDSTAARASIDVTSEVITHPDDIHLQRVPSYRTTRSTISEPLPAYVSADIEGNVATLEAAQVAQKSVASRTRYGKPAVKSQAATPTAVTPTAAVPAPRQRDVERGVAHVNGSAREKMTAFDGIITVGLCLLAPGHVCSSSTFTPDSSPEDWSNFQLKFYFVNTRFVNLQLVVWLLAPIALLAITIFKRYQLRPQRVSTRSFRLIMGTCLAVTASMIVVRVLWSAEDLWLRGMTHEQKVAAVYKVLEGMALEYERD